ncbi:hypothetical protein PFICI_00449 [Pestalotiopsis fici W106-1]|uniref:Ubiquitin 3 binding protein But2 C-terminal domain-containing protein n=1 Tax=Pestalotiopsis fici (strain W106-1 / CGMCC3.15140) TaxID=1229662 RepID=W3XMV2_PESFW|nr:uncharacterized protein PFICI_00449 [Pestalotiopsis fici W106-1]ETS86621.1 hypothetical protein PFICI_00449 [Pestalotiopsis fici W106-1]
MLKSISLLFFLLSAGSAGVIEPRDGKLFLSTFDDYQVPDERANRVDQSIGIVNGVDFTNMNYLRPVANGINNTYAAPSSPNVAAVSSDFQAYITVNYEGSTLAALDFQIFRWGCVVGDRINQSDDPIEVTGIYPGCTLTLTAFKGANQVAQQTFRSTTTRQTCSNCTTVSLISSFISNQNFRKADTITFRATFPNPVGDQQSTAFYLDDLHMTIYPKV